MTTLANMPVTVVKLHGNYKQQKLLPCEGILSRVSTFLARQRETPGTPREFQAKPIHALLQNKALQKPSCDWEPPGRQASVMF